MRLKKTPTFDKENNEFDKIKAQLKLFYLC